MCLHRCSVLYILCPDSSYGSGSNSLKRRALAAIDFWMGGVENRKVQNVLSGSHVGTPAILVYCSAIITQGGEILFPPADFDSSCSLDLWTPRVGHVSSLLLALSLALSTLALC